jgi:hypothetical protein
MGAVGGPEGAAGATGGRAGGGSGLPAAGALGGGAATTGTAEVVFFEGGGIGGEGSFTGEVALFGAGGGSGAEGSWIGAVAVFAAMGTAEVVALDGATLPVTGLTGAVASRAWVTPAPGRARRVIRTVSFFSGTAEVFGVEEGFSESLMDGGCE